MCMELFVNMKFVYFLNLECIMFFNDILISINNIDKVCCYVLLLCD